MPNKTAPPNTLALGYPVLCAWCPPGTVTVLNYIPMAGSHGICHACADAIRAAMVAR